MVTKINDNKKTAVCDYCGREFESEQGCKTHVGMKHSNELPWNDRETLQHLHHDEGLDASEIAKEFGTSAETVLKAMARLGVRQRGTRAMHTSERVCFRTNNKGYEVWNPQVDGSSRTVSVHRLLAVAVYGLDAVGETVDVHHENGVPWDNRPENIDLLDHVEHPKIHEAWVGRGRDSGGRFVGGGE